MTGEKAGERDFYMESGLHVDVYDEHIDLNGTFLEDDIGFYMRQADIFGGAVLELGAGTGRIAWALAAAGHEVVGLDLSEAMIRRAESKRSDFPDEVSDRVRFVQGDMTDFRLNRVFPLIIIPFRAFQMIMSHKDQRRSLQCVYRHLHENGRLVIDIFDPKLDMCIPGEAFTRQKRPDVNHPVTGNKIEVDITRRTTDPLTQTIREVWRFTETDESGNVIRREEETLNLRWTYRYEMRYLFELTGYETEAEFSDFKGSPPAYGGEQVWIVKKRT